MLISNHLGPTCFCSRLVPAITSLTRALPDDNTAPALISPKTNKIFRLILIEQTRLRLPLAFGEFDGARSVPNHTKEVRTGSVVSFGIYIGRIKHVRCIFDINKLIDALHNSARYWVLRVLQFAICLDKKSKH